jgi:hypothetical protein
VSVGVATPIAAPRVEFDEELEERLDDDTDYTGWFCVQTAPFPCPAEGCDFVAGYMTAAHLIVVWPANDDPSLLRYARDARNFGRDPRVVEYERSFGPCVSYYLWVKAGRPVHGKLARPEGWYAR